MSHATRVRTMGLAAAFGLMLTWSSCYKPSVQSGGLVCATPPAKQCPDGLSCIGGMCYSSSEAPAGSGGHAGTAGSGGHVATGGQVGSGGQTGAGGAMGTGGSVAPRAVGETCTIINRRQSNQSDDCVSNATCVDDCGSSVCYQTCGGDGDCPGSSCSRTTMSGSKFCEVPFVTCDPQDGTQGCDAPDQCYLLSSAPAPSGGDQTVCDCTAGGSAEGEPCQDSRDCFAGLLCPSAGMPGAGTCHRVCDATNLLASGCVLPAICNPYGSKWGYCN